MLSLLSPIVVLIALASCSSPAVHERRENVSDSRSPELVDTVDVVADREVSAFPVVETAVPPDKPLAPKKMDSWEVEAQAVGYSKADFSDVDGDLAVSRFGAELVYSTPALGGLWKIKFDVEESKYDSSNGIFDDATEVGVGASYFRRGKEWSWFATLNVNDGTGDGSNFGDGTYLEGGGGVSYAVSPTLKLGLGLIGRTQLEDDIVALPIPIIDWEINEHSRLGITRSSDPSIGYTYTVNDSFDCYVQVQRQQRQYRIDDKVLDKAAFVDEETGLRTGVIYRDPSGFRGEIFAGAAQRKLSIDVDGSEVSDEDVDFAGFIGLALTYGF